MQAKLIFQYNGYPQSQEAVVVRENITGDEYWEEDFVGRLQRAGVAATKAEIDCPYSPTCDDHFVCLRVPVLVHFDGDEEDVSRKLCKWCETYADDAATFYSDSCWLEDITE